jgi:hypothetical protein
VRELLVFLPRRGPGALDAEALYPDEPGGVVVNGGFSFRFFVFRIRDRIILLNYSQEFGNGEKEFEIVMAGTA